MLNGAPVPRKKPPAPAPPPPPPASTSELVRFGVAVERPLLDAFDQHLARRGYENRSEALRDLVRAELTRDAWDRGEQAIATISIIYDHHVRELTERLIEIQHDHGERVISATHVHLDHDHCLEVVLAKGPAHQLKRLADRLIGAKGVISGEVSGMAIVGRPHAAHDHDHDHPHAPPARAPRAPRAGKRG